MFSLRSEFELTGRKCTAADLDLTTPLADFCSENGSELRSSWGIECTLFGSLDLPASGSTRTTKLGTAAEQLGSAI